MEIFPVSKVKPGDRLARAIYSPEGRLLLAQGLALTAPEIDRLASLGVPAVYIDNGNSTQVVLDDIVRVETKAEASRVLSKIFEEIEKSATVAARDVRVVCERIIDEIIRTQKPVVRLVDVRTLADHTFGHSVGVCVLSLILGRRLGLKYGDLMDLGLGALLHDVGRALITPDVWQKNGPLSPAEWRRVRQHPKNGFELLRRITEIRVLSAHVAFQHHERWDGTGYPRGLAGNEIHQYSRIVAVADVFDALTHPRPYRPAIAVHHALGYMQTHADKQFDGKVVSVLLQCIAPYPIGTRVLLSNGMTGVVSEITSAAPDRPVVRLDNDDTIDLTASEATVEKAVSGWGLDV